jgi:hypothetical protein
MGESLAAGPENWRTSVWGSPQVRAFGAVYFPRLAEADLRVAAGDVAAFLRGCALLSGHLDAIAGGVNLSAESGITVNTATGTVTAVGSSREVLRRPPGCTDMLTHRNPRWQRSHRFASCSQAQCVAVPKPGA